MRIYAKKTYNRGERSYSTFYYDGMKSDMRELYSNIDDRYKKYKECGWSTNNLDHFGTHIGSNFYGVCVHSIVMHPRRSTISVAIKLGRLRDYDHTFSAVIPEKTYTIHSYPKMVKKHSDFWMDDEIDDIILKNYYLKLPCLYKRMWIKLGSIHIT